MALWATSASVALAEHGFPLTKHRFILKTAPSAKVRLLLHPFEGWGISQAARGHGDCLMLQNKIFCILTRGGGINAYSCVRFHLLHLTLMTHQSSLRIGRALLAALALGFAATSAALAASGTRYYVNDHLATTVGIADAAGEIAALEADAFGSPLAGVANSGRFTGKPYDSDLGAYVFPFRNYRAEEAHWMTPDPSGFPDGLNAAAYADRSGSLLDPWGLAIQTGIYNGTYTLIYSFHQIRIQSYTATYTTETGTSDSLSGSLALGYKVAKAEIASANGLDLNNISSSSSSVTSNWQNDGQPTVTQFGGKQPGQVTVGDLNLPAGATFGGWSGEPTMDEPTWGSPTIIAIDTYNRSRTQQKIVTWSRTYTYDDGKE